MDERDKLLRKARKTKNKEDCNLHKKSKNLFTKNWELQRETTIRIYQMKIVTIQVVFGMLLKKYFLANVKLMLKLTTLSVQICLVHIFLQLLIYSEGLAKRQSVHGNYVDTITWELMKLLNWNMYQSFLLKSN